MEKDDQQVIAGSGCSSSEEEQLHKVLANPAAVEGQSNTGGEEKEEKKKKKKWKTFRYPPHEADILMGLEPTPFPEMFEVDPELEALYPDTFRGLRASWAITTAKVELHNQQLVAKRDKIRREFAAKGYVTYEIEVTDDDDEEKGPPRGGGGQGQGRRRFRPGVVKHARGVKKLN